MNVVWFLASNFRFLSGTCSFVAGNHECTRISLNHLSNYNALIMQYQITKAFITQMIQRILAHLDIHFNSNSRIEKGLPGVTLCNAL